MNELFFGLGVFVGVVTVLAVQHFYNWLNSLRREVNHLYDKRRWLIRDNQQMTEFLFWKNEQKK